MRPHFGADPRPLPRGLRAHPASSRQRAPPAHRPAMRTPAPRRSDPGAPSTPHDGAALRACAPPRAPCPPCAIAVASVRRSFSPARPRSPSRAVVSRRPACRPSVRREGELEESARAIHRPLCRLPPAPPSRARAYGSVGVLHRVTCRSYRSTTSYGFPAICEVVRAAARRHLERRWSALTRRAVALRHAAFPPSRVPRPGERARWPYRPPSDRARAGRARTRARRDRKSSTARSSSFSASGRSPPFRPHDLDATRAAS